MTLDDELRDALTAAAPTAPNPADVRAALGGSMVRARRARRLRVVAASTIAGLMALSGTAVALNQIAREDPVEIGPVESLPTPETPVPGDTVAPNETPSTSTTTTPVPSTTTTEGDVAVVPDTTTTTPTTTTAPPATTATSQPTTTSAPVAQPSFSGPHTTECGEVTFTYTTSTVRIESRTVVPGYRFTTEDEGTSQLHAKWDEGPGVECEVEAHLEDGILEVQLNEDPS